ncbi:MAG: hypothetical protein M3Y36_10680, partial [Actinomycetota bacterium]|nr:hypothetical protein [Actinomycetota bacterium]
MLNGTYQVTGCATPPGAACTPAGGVKPVAIAVAAPPATPEGFRATTAGAVVALSWSAGGPP